MRIRIATRRSPLAMWQAEHVAKHLAALAPEADIAFVKIVTKGDKILDAPLAKIGGKGLFTKEIEEALLDRRADLAVHSMKDVPTELPEGLCLRAYLPREDARDVVITRDGCGLRDLPAGARVGTSSLRRTAQLKARFPQLVFVPLRGNVGTRIAKLTRGEVDAVVLAAAGVRRLGMEDRVSEWLGPEIVLPAVGQGIIGVETRTEDGEIERLVARLSDPDATDCVRAERAFLRRLGGGCQAPIAAHARVKGDTLTLEGMVAELDGSRVIRKHITGARTEAEALGARLAEAVLDAGARAILARIYGEAPA